MTLKITGHAFGHNIYYDEDSESWYYSDNDEIQNSEDRHRACNHCGMYRTKDGHDPCIENLPGVKFACCGHGVHLGYISFENGTIIRFHNVTVTTKEET